MKSTRFVLYEIKTLPRNITNTKFSSSKNLLRQNIIYTNSCVRSYERDSIRKKPISTEGHSTCYIQQRGKDKMDLHNRNQWLIIGVSGVTCGGKTSLTNKLKDILYPLYVFHQDRYFYPDDFPGHIPCEGLNHHNYDILNALNMNQMYADIVSTIQGHDKSHYSNEAAGEGKLAVSGKKIIIVEGFTVLNFAPILEICDLKYYFVLTYAQCVERRQFRVYDPPDTPGYFDHCVWPEHLRHRAEIEKILSVQLLDGTRPDALQTVLRDVSAAGR